MDIHDLHATILHLMGIDHTKLTYRYSGRDFRLTDVFVIYNMDYSMNIVQIGSNDCFTCDDCFKFVEKHHKQSDTIVCVDPNMDKLSNCLKVYEHFDVEVQIMARAITTDPNKKTLKLYYSDVEKNGQHTSFDRNHLKKMGWKKHNIKEKEYPACTANQLFGMTGFKTIDRLYVDTEGLE